MIARTGLPRADRSDSGRCTASESRGRESWILKRVVRLGPLLCPLLGPLLSLLLGISTTLGLGGPVAPAYGYPLLASLHTYQEQPGQVTLRSKQSLRDRSDRAWQLVLFKRYQGEQLQGIYLRLVGFPGLVMPKAEAAITLATGTSSQWQALPRLDPQTQALPDYANQYDIAAALAALDGDIPLELAIPLTDGSIAQLVIPPFAVHEWRQLMAQKPH